MKTVLKQRRRGFSLVEVMIAAVIMAVLVGLAIRMTDNVLQVWGRSTAKLSVNSDARIALDLLTQDLESMVLRNDQRQWIHVESEAAVVGSAPYRSKKTVALRLFSSALDASSGGGDVCGIAYHLEYKDAYKGTNAPKVYALYRAIETPDQTFSELMLPEKQKSLVGEGAPYFWTKANIVEADNFLASNIVDFRVLVYDGTLENGKERVVNQDRNYMFPVEVEDSSNQNSTSSSRPTGRSGSTAGGPPIYADIVLRVISDEAMKLLSSEGKLSQTGLEAEEYITANSKVFIRRVNLPARPL